MKIYQKLLEQNAAYLEIEGRDCLDTAIELHGRVVSEIITLAEQSEAQVA